jgi:hypothetical protein
LGQSAALSCSEPGSGVRKDPTPTWRPGNPLPRYSPDGSEAPSPSGAGPVAAQSRQQAENKHCFIADDRENRFGGMYELPPPASGFLCTFDSASMYSVCLWSIGLPLTNMGSRAACLSLGHRLSKATPPARLTHRRSGRWSIFYHSQIPMSPLPLASTMPLPMNPACNVPPWSTQPMRSVPTCWLWQHRRHWRGCTPSRHRPTLPMGSSGRTRGAKRFERYG